MKKKAILGLVILGVLVCLVIGVLLAAPLFIDPRQYRPLIEDRVSQALGRPVSLGDNLGVTLFPSARIHFDHLVITNAPGYEQENLLTVKSLEVRAKLLPLLSGDLEIKSFVMVDPRLFLESKGGQGNWEYLGTGSGPPPPAQTGSEPPAKPEPDQTSGGLWPGLSVDNLEIKDGEVSFKDQDTGTTLAVDELNIVVQGDAIGAPLHLELSARLKGQPLTLKGSLGPAQGQGSAAANTLDLNLKFQNSLEIKAAGQVGLTGQGALTDLNLDIPAFSPRALWTALKLQDPIRTNDQKALEKFGLKAHLKSDGPVWELAEGHLVVDETQMDISGRLTQQPQPRIDFDLSLNSMDLDRYREPEPPEQPAKKEKAQAGKTQAPAPESGNSESGQKDDKYAAYRNLEVHGQVKAGQLKLVGVTLDNLKVAVTGAEGQFNFDPFDLTLYQGPVNMKAQVDVRKPKPASRLEFHGHDIQVGPIFKVLQETAFMEGTMATDFELSAQGDTGDEIVPTLNGKGNVTVLDGSFETGYMPEVVLKLLSTAGFTTGSGQGSRLPFSRHEIPFTIINGVIHTPRVYLKAPQLTVVAKGKTDLVRRTLSFDVDNQIAGGPRVPMEVGGTFTSPTFKVDWGSILSLPGTEEGKDLLKKIPLFN